MLATAARINRPNLVAEPFFSFSDARNIRTGNPNLDLNTDAYELYHPKYWDNMSLSSSVYYRHTQGITERIRTPQEDLSHSHPPGKPLPPKMLWGLM